MKPFDAFDEDVATEIAGFLANEINNERGLCIGENECAMEAWTAGISHQVCVITAWPPTGERRYRVTIEREA